MKELSKILSFIKEHWWVFWLWGIFYQWFFLIINNAVNLFSWSQIPADTVLFSAYIGIAFFFFLPWLKYEDILFKKWYLNIWLRLTYAVLIFIVIFYIYTFDFADERISLAIRNLFILSILIGLFNEIQWFIGKRNNRTLVLFILLMASIVSIWGATYKTMSVKRDDASIEISYMNDRYIILNNWEIIKNTDSVVLIRNQHIAEE